MAGKREKPEDIVTKLRHIAKQITLLGDTVGFLIQFRFGRTKSIIRCRVAYCRCTANGSNVRPADLLGPSGCCIAALGRAKVVRLTTPLALLLAPNTATLPASAFGPNDRDASAPDRAGKPENDLHFLSAPN